jgi:hypothetical protein
VRWLALLVVVLGVAAPAGAKVGPDYVATDDVTLLGSFRQVGAAQGGGLHGNRLLVTSPSHLTVFDATDPGNPVLLGVAPVGDANESEDVPSNGKWAAVAEGECADQSVRGGCLGIFDVTGPPARVASLGMIVQTAACVLDCRYLWVPGEDAIVDMANPAAPKVVGHFTGGGVPQPAQDACYSVHEVRPGVVMAACDPIYVLSTLEADHATPLKPRLIATADTADFGTGLLGSVPHGARWPGGLDHFALSTTETAFSGTCGSNGGAFVVWDASSVLQGGTAFAARSSWRPSNGNYSDGHSPYNAVGCSPHFLAEHPSFRDGGLVAVAALENGIRLLRVTADGKIEEPSWFLGLGGTAALPIWHPDGRHLYVIDYARGLDVLEYSGPTYVPPPRPAPGAAPAPTVPSTTSAPRRFRVLGVIRNGRSRATIAVESPTAGTLTATPRAKGMRFKRAVVKVQQAGLVTVTIGATGKAKRVLARRGKLAVTVHITLREPDGFAHTARLRTVLRAKSATRR